MTTEHAVTVIVPAYNSAATLGRALQSVLDQTRAVAEIIVVDDASTDGIADVIASFDASITYLRQARNQGAAAARNRGVAAAAGRWVAFLDSDDRWHPEKIARQFDFMADGEWRIGCTGFRLFRRPAGTPILYVRGPGVADREALLHGCRLSPGSTLMVERTVFRRFGGFDEGLNRLEDWDWLLRVAADLPIGVLSEPLADVFNETFPVYGAVAEAVAVMREKWLGAASPLEPAAARRLRAALSWELAHAAYRAGRPLRLARHVMAAAFREPSWVLRNLAARVRRFAT